MLPPNSTEIELALETVCDRDVPTNIRDIWNADTCPLELLPWLASAFSVDLWNEDWPEYVKRGRVKNAIPIQRKKGTKAAIRDVVESFGADLSIVEWYEQTPRGVPHSFKILLNALNVSTDEIIQEINRVKPVRSQFEVQRGLNMSSNLKCAGKIRIVKLLRL